ncbi:MAG: helix-turn-helix transcriptional regulator [Erythrobacter sp.]|nr:helix-turn-helix transcriptional regulator [Erythrobacter sp.]MDZ4274198.1 helix-turn-helix transcriptional regulator [Erythrobacter sp.]
MTGLHLVRMRPDVGRVADLTPDIIARFRAKVRPAGPEDCWLWQGAIGPNGYGRMQFTRRGQTIYAHRLALLIALQEPLPGTVALHSCDNPLCVNPAHLSWGTQRSNVRQALERGRAPHKGRVAGEKNGNAKLTADVVRSIRSSSGSQTELAERFGVSRALIHAIVNRKAWTHI